MAAMKTIVVALLLALPLHADTLASLANDFWSWRAAEQPITADDVPRIDRAAGWTPDWSPSAVTKYRAALPQFESRWRALGPDPRIDYDLVGSAIARVRWELEIVRGWQRNPVFYVDQTAGALFDALTMRTPDRDDVRVRLASIPRTLDAARGNLTEAQAPLAKLAIEELADIETRLPRAIAAFDPQLDAAPAAKALAAYREWLRAAMPSMKPFSGVGNDGWEFFRQHVALLPYTTDEMIAIGRREFARAVALESIEMRRNAGAPQPAMFPSLDAQLAATKRDEEAIRALLREKKLLTVPESIHHYSVAPIPPYLEPLLGLGEADDFTSGTRWTPPPSPKLTYFAYETALDPRPLIVHEGVPGHDFQLALARTNPDPIRRHFYDSTPNEGLGFYAEELTLQAGLLEDAPHTREATYRWMRLRAARVEVDLQLARGTMSVDEAAKYLESHAPMDPASAHEEAAFFASIPGQGMTYQIGKTQIMELLADARMAQGDKFDLRAFDDWLWINGNVPIALLRRELLQSPR
jgi:Bacterial protein of unknown function (DUF885)